MEIVSSRSTRPYHAATEVECPANGRKNHIWKGVAYRYLKVYHLLRESAHLVIEAEPILSSLFRCEHRVHLSLLRITHDHFFIGACNIVFDIEGAARLYLNVQDAISSNLNSLRIPETLLRMDVG